MTDALTASFSAATRLLLACVLAGSAPVNRDTSTHIQIGGEVTCTSYSKWCYRLVLIEKDGVKSDTLAQVGVLCENSGWTSNQIHLSAYDNGDGLFDNFYEFEVWLTHNCTDDGQLRLMKKSLGKLPVNKKEYKENWRAEMTNNGERVYSYFLI